MWRENNTCNLTVMRCSWLGGCLLISYSIDLGKQSILYRDTNGWCPFCERVWVAISAKWIPYRKRLISLQDILEWCNTHSSRSYYSNRRRHRRRMRKIHQPTIPNHPKMNERSSGNWPTYCKHLMMPYHPHNASSIPITYPSHLPWRKWKNLSRLDFTISSEDGMPL